jgi:hypothetical protein
MNAPFIVAVHQMRLQFCWSGVTGMIAAFIGGRGLVIAAKWAAVTFGARRAVLARMTAFAPLQTQKRRQPTQGAAGGALSETKPAD